MGYSIFCIVIIALFAIIGFACGWKRKALRSVVKLLATLISGGLALLLSKAVVTAAKTSLIAGSADVLSGDLERLCTESEAIRKLVQLVTGGFAAPFVFAILFILIRLILGIPSLIICHAIAKKEENKPKSALSGAGGGLVGAVSIVCALFFISFPAIYLTDFITSTVVSYAPVAKRMIEESVKTDENQDVSIEDIEIDPEDLESMPSWMLDLIGTKSTDEKGNTVINVGEWIGMGVDAVAGIRESFMFKLTSGLVKPGVRYISNVDFNGAESSVYEFLEILNAFPDSGLLDLGATYESEDEYFEKMVSSLTSLSEKLSKNELFSTAFAELLSEASKAWRNGETFLGIESPLKRLESSDPFKPFISGLIEFVDEADVEKISGIISDVFESIGSYADMGIDAAAKEADAMRRLTEIINKAKEEKEPYDYLVGRSAEIISCVSDSKIIATSVKNLADDGKGGFKNDPLNMKIKYREDQKAIVLGNIEHHRIANPDCDADALSALAYLFGLMD